MRKFIKFLIGIGMLALIGGGIVLGFAIKTNAFNKEETLTKETVLEEDFENISIDIDVSDLKFELSTDGVCKVVSVEREKRYNDVYVKDNKLVINSVDTHKWYERIFDFNWDKQSVTVYLTKNVFNVLEVKDSTGDVIIDNKFSFDKANISCSTGDILFSANVTSDISLKSSTGKITLSDQNLSGDLTVKSSTGDVILKNINCANLNVDVDTGSINATNVVSANIFKLKSSTGDINVMDSDGLEMEIKTSTGNIYLEVLTPKTFEASSSTGSINVPKTSGDKCILKTSTGNITAKVK